MQHPRNESKRQYGISINIVKLRNGKNKIIIIIILFMKNIDDPGLK